MTDLIHSAQVLGPEEISVVAEDTLPRDALLTLEQAVCLPRLMGNFNARHLVRAIDGGRGPLRGYQPTRSRWFTTSSDIDEWIDASCRTPTPPDPNPGDTAGRPDSGTTRPRTAGSSSTAAAALTRAAVMAKALQLSRR